MTKILVTVGTTSFDLLIESVDIIAASKTGYEFLFQKANGDYLPKNGAYFEFTDTINDLYDQSSVVITHAGAGTIYRLLELGKKIIVVPNLERIDKHQSDIAEFMSKNGHLLVAWTTEELDDAISSCGNFEPIPYLKKEFFKYKEVAEFIEA